MIKRVKIKGKYYLQLRDNKGRILDTKKWKRGFTLKEAIATAEKTRTLRKHVRRRSLTNFSEIVTRIGLRTFPRGELTDKTLFDVPKPRVEFQGYASVRYKGETIYRTSKKKHWPNKKEAMEKAIDHVYQEIALREGFEYDENLGEKVAALEGFSIQTGIITYRRR